MNDRTSDIVLATFWNLIRIDQCTAFGESTIIGKKTWYHCIEMLVVDIWQVNI